MEPTGSLLCSHDASTEPYPELDEFNPHLHTTFPWDPF